MHIAQLHGMLVLDSKLIVRGIFHLVASYEKIAIVLPVAHRGVEVCYCLCRPVGKDGLERKVHFRLVCPRVVPAAHAWQPKGTYHCSFGHGELHGVLFLLLQLQRVFQPTQEAVRPVQCVATLHGGGADGLSRVAQRCRECQDTYVLIVQVLPRLALRLLRQGQFLVYCLSAFHVGSAPCQVTHRIFGLHPRTACHGPTRASLEG